MNKNVNKSNRSNDPKIVTIEKEGQDADTQTAIIEVTTTAMTATAATNEDQLVTDVIQPELKPTMTLTILGILPENRDTISERTDVNQDHIDAIDVILLQAHMIHRTNHRIEVIVQDQTTLTGLQIQITYHHGYNTNGNNMLKLNGSNTTNGNNMFNGKINSIRHHSLHIGFNQIWPMHNHTTHRTRCNQDGNSQLFNKMLPQSNHSTIN